MRKKPTTSITINTTCKKQIMDFRKEYARDYAILKIAEAAEMLISMGVQAAKRLNK